MVQWTIVVSYVLAMFVYAGQEVSSASYTGRLLAKWLPGLTSQEIRYYVLVLRKTGHVLAYGFLTLLVYFAAGKTAKMRRVALPFSVVFASAVALADERYQRRLVHRTGALSDVVIDGIGIVLVALVLWLGIERKRKRQEVMEDVEDECI